MQSWPDRSISRCRKMTFSNLLCFNLFLSLFSFFSKFLNPLLIMIFIPLFDRVLYPWLEAKDFNIQPLRRMEYGMFLTAVAFFASTVLEYSIQNCPPNSISLAWQIPQITILTVAEILLNVTGLEVRRFYFVLYCILFVFLCIGIHIRQVVDV